MFKLVLLALADQAGNALGAAPADKPGQESKDGFRHEAAARLASALAARHGAGFAALHVSGPLSQDGGCVLQLPGEDHLARRREELEGLLRTVMPPGLTADIAMGAGFAHVEFLKTARVLGPDLLVLGGLEETERCRRELSAFQGDAAQLVARGAPCPVLVAAQTEILPGPFECILVCVDQVDDATPQAGRLLGFAARLAAREGAALHVLHVLGLPQDQPSPDQEELVRRIARVRDRLSYLCQGLPGADRFSLTVSEGAPSVEILKHARERKADLLILVPQGVGSAETQARVLEGARCSVLLVGPCVLAALEHGSTNITKG